MNQQTYARISQQRQGGFTLIELIVVIVILGILAATALPKFVNMGADARVAALGGARGALVAATSMARGQYLLKPTSSYTFENVTVDYVSGYPAASAKFLEAAGVNSDFDVIVGVNADTTKGPVTTDKDIAVMPKSVAGTAKASTCFIKYTQATDTTAPVVTAVPAVAGC